MRSAVRQTQVNIEGPKFMSTSPVHSDWIICAPQNCKDCAIIVAVNKQITVGWFATQWNQLFERMIGFNVVIARQVSAVLRRQCTCLDRHAISEINRIF